MFSRSAAPLCRGGDPRTDPSNTVRSTSWRSMRLKAPETESHPLLIPEAPKRPVSQSAAPRCVHLLAHLMQTSASPFCDLFVCNLQWPLDVGTDRPLRANTGRSPTALRRVQI